MSGRQHKKLRQLVRRHELELAENAYLEFKRWIKVQPLHKRFVIAFKILRRTF